MYIMYVILCLFSALGRRVGGLKVFMMIISSSTSQWYDRRVLARVNHACPLNQLLHCQFTTELLANVHNRPDLVHSRPDIYIYIFI